MEFTADSLKKMTTANSAEWFRYGQSLIDTNKSFAKEIFKQIIRLIPKHADAHFAYANLLYAGGDLKTAEKHFKRSLEISPRFAEAHAAYAHLLRATGKKAQAEEHLDRAASLGFGR